MLQTVRAQLMSRPFLWLLFMCNLLGSIYGFYWYADQLAATPWYWTFFVPDSPTSSSLFTLVVLLWLIGRSSPLLEMLAMVTNIKYGIWACGVIFTYGAADGSIEPQNWMLVMSHGAMAVEVILYNFAFKFDWRLLWVGAIWLLYNDFVDYVYRIHPFLQDDRFFADVMFWTPILSIATLLLTAVLRPKILRNKHV